MAERSNPTSKEQWLHRLRRPERSSSMFKVRRGGGKEIPFIQGTEQQLHFAGAAVKRYPTPKVRETQVRWQMLQEASEGRHTSHNHRKLVNLIPWTTALSNSMKLSHACGATQDGWVMVQRSDRMWSAGERNGKPLH